MATPVQVRCIRRTNRSDAHHRISHIGGLRADGMPWLLSESEAIAGIERRRWSFFVERPAEYRVDVIIAKHLGRKYLKTSVDGEQPDNLLALPDCP